MDELKNTELLLIILKLNLISRQKVLLGLSQNFFLKNTKTFLSKYYVENVHIKFRILKNNFIVIVFGQQKMKFYVNKCQPFSFLYAHEQNFPRIYSLNG